MKAIPVSLSYTAILRVEGAPALHAQLTQRLGDPATAFTQPPDARSSLWVLESPRSSTDDINEHFAWAAALVEQHETFFRELVSSGVRVTLHLASYTNLDYSLIGFDTHLFAPFVRTGISIEFYAGLESTEIA